MKKLIILFFAVTACTQPSENMQQENNAPMPKGQSQVDDSDSEPHILKIALGSENHTTLVASVQAASIEDALTNAGPITLFAPTNTAFDKVPKETLADLLKPENQSALRNILYYHAAPGKYDLDDLKKETSLYEANGGFVNIKTEGEDVYVNGSKIIASIKASNGMIHVIDDVLLPK